MSKEKDKFLERGMALQLVILTSEKQALEAGIPTSAKPHNLKERLFVVNYMLMDLRDCRDKLLADIKNSEQS